MVYRHSLYGCLYRAIANGDKDGNFTIKPQCLEWLLRKRRK